MSRIKKKQCTRDYILVSLVLLLPMLWISAAMAKDVKSDPEPLRPADTSSPRDTLNSFLTDSRYFINDFRKNNLNEKSYRAFRRASQTLDFSTTTEGDTWFARIRRVSLLQELLARIELPADSEIPGNKEVADGSLTEWIIPNTRIKIVKIGQGPQAGKYLFSAETVQELDRLYRQAKHLPYQPNAMGGLYEEMVGADTTKYALEQQLRNRLKPIDTSTPRATLEGFLDNVNRAYTLVVDTNTALRAMPPTMSRGDALEKEKMAENLLHLASDTLDLSQVPKALRQDVGIETVLQLKEVLDRMLPPPLDAMPDANKVAAFRKEASASTTQHTVPFRWRIPNTQIEIIEIMEGDRQGQFLFSAVTVKNISGVYKKIKDLPYRDFQFGGTELEYLSPGLSPGFYDNYISTPAYLISQAHYFGRVIDGLPIWFKTGYAGQKIWQWLGLLFCLLLTIYSSYIVFRYMNKLAANTKPFVNDWLKLAAVIVALILVMVIGKFVDEVLNFTGDMKVLVTTNLALIIFVLIAWGVFVFSKAISESIIATPRMRGLSSESSLLRIGARLVGFLAAMWIIIDGLRNLGADLIPLLAGLGIGGLAVALAAQSTIANFIGGLILLANKPVRVGDFCRYGEDPSADWLRIGTIEEINWLATRIRGIDRTVTTIPNAEFANMHIVNLTKRDQRLFRTTLQLRYETTSEQIRFILIKLRELLLGHPKVTPEPARVRFIGYAAYSKDIEIFSYLRCREQSEFLAIQEDLLLRIEEIIKSAGSGFAFPSQTTYFSRDSGLDEKKAEEAETEVGHLRFSGKLPFPEFDEEERGQLEDILDYPPKGSPDYRPLEDVNESKSDK